MMMFIAFNLIGFIIFLFVFWKKLKDDYLPGQIFSTSFAVCILVTACFLLSRRFAFDWWFWSVFLGFLLGIVYGVIRFKFKLNEIFEASFLGFLIWLGLFFLGDSVKNSSLISFFAFAATMLLVGLFYFLDLRYKNFSWYRSGRVGFCGYTVAGVFFLVRLAVSLFYPFVLSITPGFDKYISGVLSFFFFLLTYNLSRSKI